MRFSYYKPEWDGLPNPIIDSWGISYWFNDEKELHRDDGPAVIQDDKWYYQHGKLHRLDGPAIEWFDGEKNWYYKGKFICDSSQQEFERKIKLLAFL